MDNRIIFHFNKKSLVDKSIPFWVVKFKGESIYVDHLESSIGFSTKETPNNEHTKGSLMFRGNLEVKEVGNLKIAYIT